MENLIMFGIDDPDTLSEYEKRKVLQALNLKNGKICGKVKGRTCAGGRPQRNYILR